MLCQGDGGGSYLFCRNDAPVCALSIPSVAAAAVTSHRIVYFSRAWVEKHSMLWLVCDSALPRCRDEDSRERSGLCAVCCALRLSCGGPCCCTEVQAKSPSWRQRCSGGGDYSPKFVVTMDTLYLGRIYIHPGINGAQLWTLDTNPLNGKESLHHISASFERCSSRQ